MVSSPSEGEDVEFVALAIPLVLNKEYHVPLVPTIPQLMPVLAGEKMVRVIGLNFFGLRRVKAFPLVDLYVITSSRYLMRLWERA